MNDLADVVGAALGEKKPKASNPPVGSGLIAASERMPDTSNGSDADLAEARRAIASAPNTPAAQAAAADLARAVGRGGVQPMEDEGQHGDLADVVSAALSEKPTAQPQAAAKSTQAEPQSKEGEISGLASLGAGAGKAVGTGALALQQLAGKGLSYVGGIGHEPTLSEAISPQKNVIQKLGDWLSRDAAEGLAKLEEENRPYAKANPKMNLGGEIAGMVLSPVNKLVPGLGPSATVGTAAIKGAAQGAVLNTLTAPVTDDSKPFLLEKAKQAGVGAVGGTIGGALGALVSKGANAGIDLAKRAMSRVGTGNPSAVADEIVTGTLKAQGLDKSQVTPELFDGIKAQVSDAIKSGQKADEKALTRLANAQTLPVPVPMLKGQITRDAMQFAKEQNLRGIQGVGEPITETLTSQNRALIANLDALGASKGADVVSAGKSAMDVIQAADKKAQQGVTAAYDAFKASTGKELDVPLQGLAQDYASAIKTFGDAIPSAIRKQFEGLGLLTGKQTKTMTISDAEALIKDINRNYNPADRAQASALDDLRKAVQKSITDGAGAGAGKEAADLAKAARQAAKARFDLIDATPGYKATIGGAEPDKFIQKFVLQGNKAEIARMMDVLKKESPEAAESFADAMISHVKSRVLNKGSSENAKFSQAQLKQFVSDPNTAARLESVIGPQKMATLRQLNQVAEDALYAPTASAVNTSNTTSAAANLVKEEVQGGTANRLLEIGKKIPGLSGVSQMAQQGVQAKRAGGLIDEAVNPSLGKSSNVTPLRDLSSLGARTGASYTGTQSRKRAQQ